jgi:Ca2+-binding EF-hand superfamily protein
LYLPRRVDLSRLRKTFDIIDSNHSGTISKWELAQVSRIESQAEQCTAV